MYARGAGDKPGLCLGPQRAYVSEPNENDSQTHRLMTHTIVRRALRQQPGSAAARLGRTAAILLLGVTAAACEDEAIGPTGEDTEGELTIDATSSSEYVYVSLADGGSVVAPADPSTSTEWHIAFRRYAAKLNGGVAGPGDVAGYNMLTHAGADGAEVLAFTTADADAAWDAVTIADVGAATFEEDGISADEGGVWFRFDPMAGTLVANPAAQWKVRESDGGYALFRVSELTMSGNAPQSVSIEYRHQTDAGGTLGAAGTVDADLSTGEKAIDFGTGAVVTPNACNWDITVTPELEITFNTGCDAGSFPLDTSETFAGLTTAADAPEYGEFLAVLGGAFPATIDDATGLFWYNIAGDNRLSPTYNVFLVRVGTDVYKVQVLGYYSATGVSGFLTLRFALLQ